MEIRKIADRIAAVVSGETGSIFTETFFEVRQKAKAYKARLEDEASAKLRGMMVKDLSSARAENPSVEISMGKYRGSRFVTSARASGQVKTMSAAKSLIPVLRRYHPAYDLKRYDPQTGLAEYNFR